MSTDLLICAPRPSRRATGPSTAWPPSGGAYRAAVTCRIDLHATRFDPPSALYSEGTALVAYWAPDVRRVYVDVASLCHELGVDRDALDEEATEALDAVELDRVSDLLDQDALQACASSFDAENGTAEGLKALYLRERAYALGLKREGEPLTAEGWEPSDLAAIERDAGLLGVTLSPDAVRDLRARYVEGRS